MQRVPTRVGGASPGVLLLLGSGCGTREEPPPGPPAGADPKAAIQQRLNNPSVSEAEKEQMRRAYGPPGAGGRSGAGQASGSTGAETGSTGSPGSTGPAAPGR